MKVSSIVSVFSIWVINVIKAPIRNISRNSKSLKGIYFFFVENRKLRFFQSQCGFYVTLRALLFFNLRLAMFA